MMVTTAGGAVLGNKWGKTPPRVLALHGWGRTHRDWEPSLGHLPCVAVDLPGFGQSPAPDEPQGSAWYAEQVAGFPEKHGPMVVVGHSFGGRVAVHLAASRPELVQAVVLTGAPLVRIGEHVKPSMPVRVAKALHAKGLLPQSVMDGLKQRHGSPDYRAAQGVMRDILVRVLHENYDEQLRAIDCPLACVYGELDTAAPPDVARAIATRVPQATVEIVSGQPHSLTGGLGDRIAAAVEAGLDDDSK